MKRVILFSAVIAAASMSYAQQASDLHQPSAQQLIEKGQLDAVENPQFTNQAQTPAPEKRQDEEPIIASFFGALHQIGT